MTTIDAITPGAFAVMKRLPYHRVSRAIRGRTDVPGLIRLPRGVAFDAAKVDELVEWMKANGVFDGQEMYQDEHLVPTGADEALA